MTSIIKMCPLSGGRSETPHCYFLEMDSFNFLLDCGWDQDFDPEFIKELKKYVGKIDAVLLSFPDTQHLGALPYAVGKLGLGCPIYATVPVFKMGQMFMYDVYEARRNIEDFDLFTLDEVDATFEKITQLKYNQTINLKGKGEGISITPLPAGHMIGGTIWKILKDGEEDIIYAVDFNHKKERHLNGCDLDKIQRPSLLITDAYNVNCHQLRRRMRDEKIMTNILQTLRGNGNVLVCTDTAGRVLELAHMVDQLWQNKDSGLLAYSLALVNNFSYSVVEFAKSQIEWMSEKLMKTFEGRRNNPFQFKHLKLCHSMSEVNKVPSPKVVLASMPDMESGYSREIFMQWCTNSKNSIILTSRSPENTLAHDLMANGGNRSIELEVRKRVKLTGFELEEFKRRQEEKENHGRKRKNSVLEEEDESSDEEMEPPGKKHDIIMKSDKPGDEPKPQTGFFKSTKTKYPMFPTYEEKIRWDDYGELIKPEDWMDVSLDTDKTNGVHKEEKEDDSAEQNEVPTKCVSSMQVFHVKAQVQYIDFEGRSEGESILKLIQQIKPRRVIIVRGTPKKCDALKDFCLQIPLKGAGDQQKINVYSPENGEVVDVTTESYIYQVRLPESLVKTLEFSKGKDGHQLAWVDGIVNLTRDDTADIIQTEDEENREEGGGPPKKPHIPQLDPLPLEFIKGHQATFVNELKLSDFKMVLTKNSISSEFQGGVLFCGNGMVALRRHDSGRVTIEGTLCNEYYRVRDLLYEQYAIV